MKRFALLLMWHIRLVLTRHTLRAISKEIVYLQDLQHACTHRILTELQKNSEGRAAEREALDAIRILSNPMTETR